MDILKNPWTSWRSEFKDMTDEKFLEHIRGFSGQWSFKIMAEIERRSSNTISTNLYTSQVDEQLKIIDRLEKYLINQFTQRLN